MDSGEEKMHQARVEVYWRKKWQVMVIWAGVSFFHPNHHDADHDWVRDRFKILSHDVAWINEWRVHQLQQEDFGYDDASENENPENTEIIKHQLKESCVMMLIIRDLVTKWISQDEKGWSTVAKECNYG